MAQCLTKLKVRASTGSAMLLNIVKNPVSDHLPLGCKLVGTSSKAPLKTMEQYVAEFTAENTKKTFKPVCYVIWAVSVGNPGIENGLGIDAAICIASLGLSAACVCHKLCSAYEELWNVV